MINPSLEGERIVVLIDGASAATPSQIAEAVRGAHLAFALPSETEYGEDFTDLLSAYGEILPSRDSSQITAWNPTGIVTFSEGELMTTARLAESLDLPGPGVAAVSRCTDKAMQREIWSQKGIDSTRFATASCWGDVHEAVKKVGVPCVVKPRRGSGSRDVYRITSLYDLKRLEPVNSMISHGWVVEELLCGFSPDGLGDYVSVEVATDTTQTTALAVTAKLPLQEPFREQGGILPADLPAVETLGQIACRAVDAVGIEVGLAHVEITMTEPVPRLVEVNARLGGYQENLVRAAGSQSFIAIALDLAVGRPAPVDFLNFTACGWWFAPTPPAHIRTITRVDGIDDISRWPGISRAAPRHSTEVAHDPRLGWGQYAAFIEGGQHLTNRGPCGDQTNQGAFEGSV